LSEALERRAALFAALGEPLRLALVDRLIAGDLSPGELARSLGLGTNLLAHHLRVLEEAGVIRRTRSEGDRRRSYIRVRLDDPTIRAVARTVTAPVGLPATVDRVLFVCTANSARSQFAAASWNSVSPIPAASAGTHPAPQVHPRAVRVARRHGMDLESAVPADIENVRRGDELIVAVCDNAHEELTQGLQRLHWSVPDPASSDTDEAFEDAYVALNQRVHDLSALQAGMRKAS
jgi:protein-tyrosine-phosphatase